jgi:hypothetical protein
LKDLKYPRMYYRKNSGTALVGGYIAPSTPENAGFTTSAKSRSKILAKLEEVLRNKQLISYSSRFYEELKVFTWQSGKVQAKRGFNDDLVMSLAIGSWLFDASSDYSKNSKALNDAMLNAMTRKSSDYQDTPDAVLSQMNVLPIFTDRRDNKTNVKTNVKDALKRSNIPKDMYWILK